MEPVNETFTAVIASIDDSLAASGASGLAKLHARAVQARTLEEILLKVKSERPGLLILDYALPCNVAIDICHRLREIPDTATLPIIMITPTGNGSEKIHSLEAGADDCLSKPIRSDVLIAYINALRRRLSIGTAKQHLRAGPVEMDLDRWIVVVSGRSVDLTNKEFSLLRVLLEARGRALTRDFLLQEVWSHGAIHGLDTRTIDVHIGRLRRKLGGAGQFIITVRNVGFRFEMQPEWIKSYDAR